MVCEGSVVEAALLFESSVEFYKSKLRAYVKARQQIEKERSGVNSKRK